MHLNPQVALRVVSFVIFFLLIPTVLALLEISEEEDLVRVPLRAAEESLDRDISDIGSQIGSDLGSEPESEVEHDSEVQSKLEFPLDQQCWVIPESTADPSMESRGNKDPQISSQPRGKDALPHHTQYMTPANNEVTRPTRSETVKTKSKARMGFELDLGEKLYDLEDNDRSTKDEELFGGADDAPFEFIGTTNAREIPTDLNAPQRRTRVTFRRSHWKSGTGK